MFQRIRNYGLISAGAESYRPRAYGDRRADGTWDGYLVFFPLRSGPAVATDRESTQSTFDALTVWADGLTVVYLEGALMRALQLAEQPSILTQLEEAEYDALDDAERLETAAEVERLSAAVDEAAAAQARVDADQIRRDRLTTEGVLAATEEAIATREAEVHTEAAREARAVATEAARLSRQAHVEAQRPIPTKSRARKKK